MLKTAIIKDGWPERKIDLAQNLKPFWSQWYNLSIDEDGFIVKWDVCLYRPDFAKRTSRDCSQCTSRLTKWKLGPESRFGGHS
jgi:hypothetical protein